MSYCVFCVGQDDGRDRKIYNACDIVGGTPCVPCAEYMEMEAQVEKTRQILKDQLAIRREIRQNINRLHDPMLRRVPREIISQIFELAARVDVTSEGTALLDGEIYAPLPLGHICGAWRDIAWGIPQFWTFISVRIRTIEQFASRFDMAKQWLVRSGDYLPLSIHFRIHETCKKFSEDEREFLPFIELINGYSHRWKDLCAHCPGDLFYRLITNRLGAPILQNLQLSSPYQSELGKIFGVRDDSLPQPRSLRLDNVVLRPDSGVDWGQISHLTLDAFPAPRILEILPLLHNLQDLRILGVFEHPWPRKEPNIVYLKLHTFHMDCLNSKYHQNVDELYKLLRYMSIPSLQHLTINLLYNLQLNNVTSLIQRSSCKLSSLSLVSIPGNSDNFTMDLLEYLDSLKILEITTNQTADRTFLQALYNSLHRQLDFGFRRHPLANLQQFKYIDRSGGIPWGLLLAIFDRNWCATRPQWRMLSIVRQVPESPEEGKFGFDDVDEEIIHGFVKLVKAGIEVILPEGLDEVIRANVDSMSESMDEV